MAPLRIFFDTEFSRFREGRLLSIGLVDAGDRALYLEVHEAARHADASDFCRSTVLPQFGLLPNARVTSDAQAGERLAGWLTGFGAPLLLCHDYKLDWHFLETALRAAGAWDGLEGRLTAFDVADVANDARCLAAQESFFLGRTMPGRHHALIDAQALRERWRAHEALELRTAPSADIAGAIGGPLRKILWVDDHPENNRDAAHRFERLGFHISYALSTGLAMTLLARNRYVAVVSDMVRRKGPREGYHLLDLMRSSGNETPFFFYAGSAEPAHVDETLLHGGDGSTQDAMELVRMVTAAAKE
jgi:CheY-like chemotaxis protein